MADKAAKRRAIANKLAADIPRLRQEIADRRAHLAQAKSRALAKPHKCRLTAGWFDAWSRYVGPLARAEGALARALKRLPAAADKAEDAEYRAKEAAALKRRIAEQNKGLTRRLDALRAVAPEISKRWAKERAEEGRRLKKLRKALEKRTNVDKSPRPEWMRKPVTLPPPVEQPNFDDDAGDAIAPPREGLIPGTWAPLDPRRIGAGLLDAVPLPPVWTWQHVGERMIEAHSVIGRLPATIWPKGFGAMWPAYKHEAGELAIQAGAGTLAVGRNVIVRTASADEVARANQAIAWPMQFLSAGRWAAETLNTWAMSEDADPEINGPKELLQFIADALNAAKEVVR